jgi:SNF2 family DNA or RNA helicase
MITSALKVQKRQELVNLFQQSGLEESFQELELDDDQQSPESSSTAPDILIGTTLTLGVGLTCTRAFRLIQLEPDYVMRNEKQGVKRINRIGQKNPKTYSYRLTCPDSEIENNIIDRHTLRSRFQTVALEAGQDNASSTEARFKASRRDDSIFKWTA